MPARELNDLVFAALAMIPPAQTVVLIAEDSEDDAALIRLAFRKNRLLNALHFVSDGEEAIAYLKGQGKYTNRSEYPLPALLLLDLKMPKRNGFEVLQWIRAQPTLSALRVVVLTSSYHLRDVKQAYQLGANSYLTKPMDLQDLVVMTRALAGYWLWMSETPDIWRPSNGASKGDGLSRYGRNLQTPISAW